jgi:hypothetical protein
MRHLLLGGLLAALVVAGLGVWLHGREGARPPGADAPAEETEATAAPPAAGAEPPDVPSAAVAAEPGPGLDVAPGAKRVAPARPPVSAAPPPAPEDPYPSFDRLLELPPPAPAGPQSVEWAGQRGPAAAGESRDPARRRVRLDYSRKSLTEGVPMQPERRRTDVGVSVRVDESDRLRVRGGVRVEEREEAGEEEREADRTPTVGVEVRF